MDAAHDILLAQIDRIARDAAADMARINQDGLFDDLLASKNAAIEGLRERLATAEAALAQALKENPTYADLRHRISNLENRAVTAEKELSFLRDHIQQDLRPRYLWLEGRLSALTGVVAGGTLPVFPADRPVTLIGLECQQTVPGLPGPDGSLTAATACMETASEGIHALEFDLGGAAGQTVATVKIAVMPIGRRFVALHSGNPAETRPLVVIDLFESRAVQSGATSIALEVGPAEAGWTMIALRLSPDIEVSSLIVSTALTSIGANRFLGTTTCGFAMQGPWIT